MSTPDPSAPLSPASGASAGDLYHQIGHLTRQLHDTLGQLGVMPRLQAAADGLPDARSRLNYVAQKTADAAHRVLNAVDAAKDEQRLLGQRARGLIDSIRQDGGATVSAAAVLAFAEAYESSAERLDGHLTDIMMAQDFHDLTGQVVRKVLDVANALEDNLVALLVQAAPAGSDAADAAQANSPASSAAATAATAADLQGPVVAGTQQGDVVTSQSEVDDLLSSLGF